MVKRKHLSRYWPFEGEIQPVTGFSSQRPVMRSFDVFFDLSLNKRLSKLWRRRWFETPSPSLWRQCDVPSSKKEKEYYVLWGPHNCVQNTIMYSGVVLIITRIKCRYWSGFQIYFVFQLLIFIDTISCASHTRHMCSIPTPINVKTLSTHWALKNGCHFAEDIF